jgi:CheY-like chemotaxis protein
MTLPILAITANVMAEDIELCLAAGMDEHLQKPINRQVLGKALEHWLPPNHSEEAALDEAAVLLH